ncbi:MAG: TIM barrel protein [Planctomycetes bacterium]|nr:TIM barrel protein [Planctomycetota bacterium]
MAKLSLCLEMMFPEVEIYDRIAIAKDLGYDAFEFWDPSQYDVKKIAAAAAKAKLPLSVCTLKQNWTYRLSFPYSSVLKNVQESIAYGKELGCMTFIGLSGEVETHVEAQKNILIDNLKRVADLLEKENATIVVEALNSTVDHKGYYLDSSYVGFEIIKCVNSPRVKLLYDIYHMQIMEGNVIQNIQTNIDMIGHFHSAGVPGRHERQLGENDYPNIIKAIDAGGYDGYFCLEYLPSYDSKKSAADVLAYLRK